jgi:nucleotide-binding universal stress UspA family protein
MVLPFKGGMMKPILLATDGSPCAEGATLEAIELARAFDAPLLVATVVHVALPAYGSYYGYGEIAADLQRAELERVTDVLATIEARVKSAGVRCETIALNGLVAAEICRVALEREARLVVIGAHGWGRLGRIVHGSVSTAVLHDAPCPVLVVQGVDQPLDGALAVETAVAH